MSGAGVTTAMSSGEVTLNRRRVAPPGERCGRADEFAKFAVSRFCVVDRHENAVASLPNEHEHVFGIGLVVKDVDDGSRERGTFIVVLAAQDFRYGKRRHLAQRRVRECSQGKCQP